jgi:hypothetical protein
MKKVFRIKKASPVITAAPSKLDPDLQAGKKILLRAIPEDIRKAKRFFKVGNKYRIQEPPENHLNTPMAVYVKGDDGNTYLVGFPYFVKTPNELKVK